MNQANHPCKEAVRQWLRFELEQRRPPPDPQQIRRELGWDVLQAEPAKIAPR